MTLKKLLTFCLALYSTSAFAVDLDLSGTQLTVPTPAGYELVTEKMALFFEMKDQFVIETNIELASYVPNETVAELLVDIIPLFERRFSVQVSKALANKNIARRNFDELKGYLKDENQKVFDEIKAQLPTLESQINTGISENYDVDIGLALNGITPLEPHLNTDNSFGYSSYVSYKLPGEDGTPETHVSVTTNIILYLKERLVFLYVFGSEEDLNFTREEGNKWVTAIIEANPYSAADTTAEAMPEVLRRINWGSVLTSALVGGASAFLVFLWSQRRRRTKDE